MGLTVGGLVALIVVAVIGWPSDVGVGDGLTIAATVGRLQTFDFSFDLSNQYTFWSGTIAALFLFCSYFGTDQSQVQRYLTARSVDEARHSLLMSAYWKIPLQMIVLLVGVLIFVFYVFNPPPLLFSSVEAERLRSGSAAPAYAALQSEFDAAFEARRVAAQGVAAARASGDEVRLNLAKIVFHDRQQTIDSIRARAAALARETSGDRRFSDVNYIIPTFILTHLPIGLVGLLIVTIVMTATDTIAGELNSLSTATVIDFYRRRVRPTATDAHYLAVSKIATGLWGLFACGVAVWAAQLGSLIEVVNRFGSFFYGSILGVFILAIAFRRATGTGAFLGLVAGMGSVAWAAAYTSVAFLWQNVIGALAVVIAGVIVSEIDRARRGSDADNRKSMADSR
jgi:Na+/proline symporter